ncbi:hypothetical protein AYI70_g9979, partial [Smittium culicis]
MSTSSQHSRCSRDNSQSRTAYTLRGIQPRPAPLTAPAPIFASAPATPAMKYHSLAPVYASASAPATPAVPV